MARPMKTTIEIADPLFAQARRLAAREGTTLRAVLERGLREVLKQETPAKPFRLRRASFKGGEGLRPEIQAAGWEAIRAAAYGTESGV